MKICRGIAKINKFTLNLFHVYYIKQINFIKSSLLNQMATACNCKKQQPWLSNSIFALAVLFYIESNL